MRNSLRLFITSVLCGVATLSTAQPASLPAVDNGLFPGGARVLEQGQVPAIVHPTVEAMEKYRAAHKGAAVGGSTTSTLLSYQGGVVATAPKVYLILWGSQWNKNDPSNEVSILSSFFTGVGGSSWLGSVTQYCQGVPKGSTSCAGGTAAGNQQGMLAGIWYDNAIAAPRRPGQSQFAAEAVRAAAYFGNTTAGPNQSAQYIIATATGNNATGFGTQYCAWHSSTTSKYGDIAYTNLPYMTDAGASCGANFNGLGPTAGITIVTGHELAETITDQFPNYGWLDSAGAENGDKCAWISSGQGATASVTLVYGTFPLQSLWSNAFNSGKGGCVLSYP